MMIEHINENYVSMMEVYDYLSVQRQTVLSWIAQKNPSRKGSEILAYQAVRD